MKIVVPIKQVTALEDEFELLPDESGVDPDAIEYDLNEWDRFSLEAAGQLRDTEGGEVVTVTVGDEQTEEALRAALAATADRAIRIWGEGLSELDPIAVARLLAPVVGAEEPDLVLCGVQSSDAVNGATGVALAAFLDMPRVAVVKHLEHHNGELLVHRELEDSITEVVRVGLPALLTIQTGINEPRYATLRQIKQAAQKPLDVVDASGAEAGRPAMTIRRLLPHETAAGASMLEGGAAELAAQIAELVRTKVSS